MFKARMKGGKGKGVRGEHHLKKECNRARDYGWLAAVVHCRGRGLLFWLFLEKRQPGVCRDLAHVRIANLVPDRRFGASKVTLGTSQLEWNLRPR